MKNEEYFKLKYQLEQVNIPNIVFLSIVFDSDEKTYDKLVSNHAMVCWMDQQLTLYIHLYNKPQTYNTITLGGPASCHFFVDHSELQTAWRTAQTSITRGS